MWLIAGTQMSGANATEPAAAVLNAAGGVFVELDRFSADRGRDVGRSAAGGQAPHIGAVAGKAARVLDGVLALGPGGALGIDEIIDALAAHEGVGHAAEVEPDMRILVAEHRRKAEIGLTEIAAPG